MIVEHEYDFNTKEYKTKEEIKAVDKYIVEKEEFLERISKEQFTLETEVINSMKN